jgi:uncharacterized coiled-coil DUF342 family protein
VRLRLKELLITTRQTVERVDFSAAVTFLYGPVGTGKSTVARLIDYCFGGELERTPAIQREFIAAQLGLELGNYHCTIERSDVDTQSVRVTWSLGEGESGSINAPLVASAAPLVDGEVYNLSDLLFYLAGITPIKVRQRSRDAESPMVRLSFRDIWWYCYLEQTHLDSTFFRLEDPFRGRKSQDAMRFFTGLHSERLSALETDLYRTVDEQHGKREAVRQIRQFMSRFELGSELEVEVQITKVKEELSSAEARRGQLEADRETLVHPTDPLRERLRVMGKQIAESVVAIRETEHSISEQRALRAELITTKIKANRTEQAGRLLEGVDYARCPECGSNISDRVQTPDNCRLCGSTLSAQESTSGLELEAVRRELNDRIDQIAESIQRREVALNRSVRQLDRLRAEKAGLDQELQQELARYDSAFVESVRALDREIATLIERLKSLAKLQAMPRAIYELEEEAGSLQGQIDRLRSAIDEMRASLRRADENVGQIAERFKEIMVSVGFPGVAKDDEVVLDPRNWRPLVVHGDQEWTFWDAGSGGKKTLFNVCYALAVHEVARERGMPVPTVLIIDSPTKNISEDENPELVRALYREIYRLARPNNGRTTQFLLIDSNLVEPEEKLADFSSRHLAGTPEDLALIPYYDGP